MGSNEISPSFSFKYFVLIFIVCVITKFVDVVFQANTEEKSQKKISLSVEEKGASIKNTDSSNIEFHYHKSITITNIGESGIDDLTCKIRPQNSNAALQPYPHIESSPPGIEFDINRVSDTYHVVQIPLLNKEEVISFFYTAYTKSKIEFLDLSVLIRKKDLLIITTTDSPIESYDFLIKIVIEVAIVGIATFAIFIITALSQWNDIYVKKKHKGKFWRFVQSYIQS